MMERDYKDYELEVFHISPTHNRKSILKNGLAPTKVQLPGHLEKFRERNLVTKDDKAIYTWEAKINNEKLIKDMVYAHVWIHPRNNLVDYGQDFSKLSHLPKLYKFDEMIFDVYVSKVYCKDDNNFFVHQQYPSENKNESMFNMNEYYAHFDKHLRIFNYMIIPEKVGEVLYKFEKSDFTIKILK